MKINRINFETNCDDSAIVIRPSQMANHSRLIFPMQKNKKI